MEMLVFLFSVLVFSNCHEIGPSSEIADADASNIKELISQHQTSVILFYAPWCGYCKLIMPEYEKVCQEAKVLFSNSVLCARVNCSQNEALCSEHQLQGFPTIKLLREASQCVYKGPRDSPSMLKWVRSSHNSMFDVTDSETVAKAIDESRHTVLGYFTNASHPLRKLGEQVVCDMPELEYVVFSDAKVAEEHGIAAENTLNVFKEKKLVKQIEEVNDLTELNKILFLYVNELVPEFQHNNAHNVFTPGIRRYVAFLYSQASERDEKMELLNAFAESKFGEVRVFTVNASDDMNRHVVDFFRISTYPMVVFYNDQTQKFYHYQHEDGQVDEKKLEAFISGCIDGKIQHYVRKQPVPEDWDKRSVKELVVDNFDQVFEKYPSGGAILFYASWCGHCEKLMPTWMKLGTDLAPQHPEIFIGRIDHAENEIAGITVDGYPTIYVFKSRTEKVLYDGERDYDDISKFITANLVYTQGEDQPQEKTKTEEDAHDEL